MALVSWNETFTSDGTVVANGAVYVYLAGTETAARVFDENDNVHTEVPQVYTDSDGYIAIQIDSDDYPVGQLFDLEIHPESLCSSGSVMYYPSMALVGGKQNLGGDGSQIVSGQTGYNTGTGFWLGMDGDTPKLSVGVSTGDYFTWDGSTLSVSGTITVIAGSIAGLTISATDLTATAGGNTTIVSSGATAFTAGPTGTPTFTVTQAGVLTCTSGYIGGWAIGSTSLTSTTLGLHSGASAQILLGHATDYATAKIGLKNDGSGKLASGNIAWDASGNITIAGSFTSSATITGGTIQTAVSGARSTLSSSGLSIYDATTQRARIGSDGSGWLGSASVFSWTTAGVLTASGFTAGTNTLNYTNGGNSTIVSATGTNAFTAGPTGAPTFNVTHAGVMTCTGASIGGTLTVGTVPGLPSDANLVAYWSFDEGADTTVANLVDTTNKGTWNAGAAYTAGVSGKAGDFSGAAGVRVDANNPILSETAWSISFWASKDAVVTNTAVISDFVSGVNANLMIGYNAAGSDTEFRIYVGSGANTDVAIFTVNQFASGQGWHHYVVTYSAAHALILYVDGVQHSTDTLTYDIGAVESANGFMIGAYQSYEWNGQIDEVRFYDKVLSTNEVHALYVNPSGNKADSTKTIIDQGMITTGSITLNASGHIKGGQTAYNTGTGWWIGYDSGAPAGYKISVGVSGGQGWTWSGTALSVTGDIAITNTHAIKLYDGSDIIFYAADGVTPCAYIDLGGGDAWLGTSTYPFAYLYLDKSAYFTGGTPQFFYEGATKVADFTSVSGNQFTIQTYPASTTIQLVAASDIILDPNGGAAYVRLTGWTGIGTASPHGLLHVSSDGLTNDITFSCHNNGDSAHAILYGIKSGGTEASPTVVADSERLLSICASGYSGAAANFLPAAVIRFEIDGTPDSGGDTTDMPGRILFLTTPDGSATPTERMRITNGGIIQYTFGTENLEIIDAGSAGATEQDWIQVEVGGNTGYIRVYASK